LNIFSFFTLYSIFFFTDISYSTKESGLKPFAHFQHLLEELPQIGRTDKEELKRYLPYSDALPTYCKAPDQETNN